jgi:hypothetical protein
MRQGSTKGVSVKRLISVAAAAGLLCLQAAAGAQADSATTARHGRMRGIVFAHSVRFGRRVNNLAYHGGPVMHTNSVYAIYWIPSGYTVQTGYQSVIDSFFKNVAAVSASTLTSPLSTNVYWSDTQYYDGAGNIQYNSTFIQDIPDSDSYPANGCRDRYTSVCLTDGQLQAEIQHVITTQGLPTGVGTAYFLLTPENVGSCFGSYCAYTYFCAYHSDFTLGNGAQVLYANLPYANWVQSACGSGESPNGNDADSTINLISHEHNETITDPLGTAWYDSSGNEDGDKCAWNFGTSSEILGPAGAQYNQTINGAHYYLQQEWSNHSSGCVLQGL